MKSLHQISLLMAFIGMTQISHGQSRPGRPEKVANTVVNYDEALAGEYILPNLLVLKNGKKVTNAESWTKKRRPEVLQLFEKYQFGKIPAVPPKLHFKVFENGTPVFNGKAIRKQVTIYFTKDTTAQKVDLLIYLPAKLTKPSPLLLTISFVTNAMAIADTAVKRSMAWVAGKRIVQSTSTFNKIDVKKFIDNGIGYATLYYGDIEPDFKEGIRYGIRSLYLRDGQTRPAADEWGAIAAWSWGLSRVMDYLETDKDVDAKRVALTGASRLGKTALWTGARDQRFALIIPAISGEGGAALSRRNYGETVKMITDTARYFYQFAPNYHDYSDRVNDLPMDSHMLIALVAPRPVLLLTGDQDYFSDAKGEFLAARAATPVYQLFGKSGIEPTDLPPASDTGMLNTLGFYMHSGGHTVLPEDYDIIIRFISEHFRL